MDSWAFCHKSINLLMGTYRRHCNKLQTLGFSLQHADILCMLPHLTLWRTIISQSCNFLYVCISDVIYVSLVNPDWQNTFEWFCVQCSETTLNLCSVHMHWVSMINVFSTGCFLPWSPTSFCIYLMECFKRPLGRIFLLAW